MQNIKQMKSTFLWRLFGRSTMKDYGGALQN